MFQKVVNFFKNVKRIFHIARKPNWKEFKVIAIVSGLGILIIGLIGFVIQLITYFLKLLA